MSGVRSTKEACQAIESTLMRQLLQASGAFKAGESSGGQIRADMFVEALADAVAKTGGLGVAKMIEKSLGGLNAAEDDARDAQILQDPGTKGSREEPVGQVSSPFGPRKDPVDGTPSYHTGIDLAVPEGMPVHAAAGGVVKAAGSRGAYGQAVEIDHGNGLSTLYGHNSQVSVKTGETVEAGQVIAKAGATGKATGPHVHFEVRKGDHPINPQRALNAYGIRAEDSIAGTPRTPKRRNAP